MLKSLDVEHTSKVLSSIHNRVEKYNGILDCKSGVRHADALSFFAGDAGGEDVQCTLSELSFIDTTCHEIQAAVVKSSKSLAGLIGVVSYGDKYLPDSPLFTVFSSVKLPIP
jgi:hypothetical protein